MMGEYVSFISQMLFVFGITFEVPVIIVFLSLASSVRLDSFSVPNMIMSIVGKIIGLAVVLFLMRMRERQAAMPSAA